MNATGKDWVQVFTYFGHHSQDGWQARFGLYAFEERVPYDEGVERVMGIEPT